MEAVSTEISPYFGNPKDLFEFGSLLGEGSFGSVYKALRVSDQQEVAIKQINIDDPTGFQLESFNRETYALRNLSHPNIISFFGSFIVEDFGYIALGLTMCDLTGYIGQLEIGLGEKETKRLSRQILAGLAHCHSLDIIHRDIKPENILIDEEYNARLCDFGISRDQSLEMKTLTTEVVTRQYRCPELLLGATVYSFPVDIWSVGCVIAEMFTGRILLPGTTDLSMLHKIITMFGKIDEENWPGVSDLKYYHFVRGYGDDSPFSCPGLEDWKEGEAFIKKLMVKCPAKRLTAKDAILDSFFQ